MTRRLCASTMSGPQSHASSNNRRNESARTYSTPMALWHAIVLAALSIGANAFRETSYVREPPYICKLLGGQSHNDEVCKVELHWTKMDGFCEHMTCYSSLDDVAASMIARPKTRTTHVKLDESTCRFVGGTPITDHTCRYTAAKKKMDAYCEDVQGRCIGVACYPSNVYMYTPEPTCIDDERTAVEKFK